MKDSLKEGYIGGTTFIVVGLLFLYVGWGVFDLSFFIGIGLSGLGLASFKWPAVAEILVHWISKQGRHETRHSSQVQRNTENSTQASAGRDVKVVNNYLTKGLPEEKESNEKKELIKEINQDLTKEQLSNVLIKCIRLAILTGSEKEKKWLEEESQGLGKGRIEVKKGTLPHYREIDAKIIVAGKDGRNQTDIDYPLGLIHPIFQIEGWIEDAKTSNAKEMVLTGSPSKIFKKVYQDNFGKDAPLEEIPSIISINQLKAVLNGLKLEILKFVNSFK